MNLNNQPTIEELAEMFAAQKDTLDDHILWIGKSGEVQIDCLAPHTEEAEFDRNNRELAARLRELPKQRDIVAYCRGPYCVMAIEAVALLREHGYTAQRMEQGVLDWRARGWQVAVEPPRSQS